MTNEESSFWQTSFGGWSDKALAEEIARIGQVHKTGDAMVWLQVLTNERYNRSTAKAAAVARLLTYVALGIAVLSTGVTAWYSHQAALSSERWEKSQITLLEAFRNEAAAARQDIEKLQTVAVSIQREIAAQRAAPAKPRSKVSGNK